MAYSLGGLDQRGATQSEDHGAFGVADLLDGRGLQEGKPFNQVKSCKKHRRKRVQIQTQARAVNYSLPTRTPVR